MLIIYDFNLYFNHSYQNFNLISKQKLNTILKTKITKSIIKINTLNTKQLKMRK